ncbi:MAG: hypothetical protein LBM87_08450 [Ruminococcus sp.]|jgi:hypothetical protein|nr:hypothetical protein [Ruminococcus sp.]
MGMTDKQFAAFNTAIYVEATHALELIARNPESAAKQIKKIIAITKAGMLSGESEVSND